MFSTDDIPEIETKLGKAGVTLVKFCSDCEIDVSTWRRWRLGTFHPSYRAAKKVGEVLAKMAGKA